MFTFLSNKRSGLRLPIIILGLCLFLWFIHQSCSFKAMITSPDAKLNETVEMCKMFRTLQVCPVLLSWVASGDVIEA